MSEPEPADDVVEVVTAPTPRPHRRAAVVAVSVVVLLVAGGTIAWSAARNGGDVPAARPPWTGSAIACPATVDHPVDADGLAQSVPALPAAPAMPGLDERLVPAEAPRAVTLCEFDAAPGTVFGDPAAAAAGLPLTRTAEFEEGDNAFTGLVTSLQDAPVPGEGFYICASWVIGNGAAPDHLIGLTYDDGVVWLAVGPADCSGTENGEFHSGLDVRERVIAMLAAAPPASDPDEPCVAVGSPRPGTADRFVPFTPTSVLVCHAGPDSPAGWTSRREQPADVAAVLRSALVAVPAQPADPAVATCVGVPVDRWALLFTGAGGAQELVLVNGGACHTADNGWRDGQVDDGFLTLLEGVD